MNTWTKLNIELDWPIFKFFVLEWFFFEKKYDSINKTLSKIDVYKKTFIDIFEFLVFI